MGTKYDRNQLNSYIQILCLPFDAPGQEFEDDTIQVPAEGIKEGILMCRVSGSKIWNKETFTLDLRTAQCQLTSTKKKRVTQIDFDLCFCLESREHREFGLCDRWIQIYSNNQHYVLGCKTESDINEWIRSLYVALRRNYSASLLEDKRHAAMTIGPLLLFQMNEEEERLSHLIGRPLMQETGIFSSKDRRKHREGRLDMYRIATKEWVRVFVSLQQRYVVFCTDDKHNYPIEVVLLKYIVNIECASDDHTRSEFLIVSPLRKIRLRTKHEGAMVTWCSAFIERIHSSIFRGDIEPVRVLLGDDSGDGSVDSKESEIKRVRLEYRSKRKAKSIVLESTRITIGRATECTLILKDSLVSRYHCQIEKLPGRPLVLFDMGSSQGTWVDGEKIIVKIISIGMVFTVGTTQIRIEAVD